MSHYICDILIDCIKLLLCFYIYWLSFLYNNNKLELILMNLISFLIYFSKYIYRIYYKCNINNDITNNTWLKIDFIHFLFLTSCILSNIIKYNNIIFSIYLSYIILIYISYIIRKYNCINQVEQCDIIEINIENIESNENLESIENIEENTNITNNKDIICIICLEEFTNIKNIQKLKCNHYYHKLCLQKWLDSNPNKICPICKYKIIE